MKEDLLSPVGQIFQHSHQQGENDSLNDERTIFDFWIKPVDQKGCNTVDETKRPPEGTGMMFKEATGQ